MQSLNQVKVGLIIAAIVLIITLYFSSRRSARDKRYREMVADYTADNPALDPGKSQEDIDKTLGTPPPYVASDFRSKTAKELVTLADNALNSWFNLPWKDNDTLFNRLIKLSDYELKYVYMLYNQTIAPGHNGKTLTQAIADQWFTDQLFGSGNQDALVKRMKALKLL